MKKWLCVIAASLCLVGAAVALGSHCDYGGYDIVLRANWGFVLPHRGTCSELYQAYYGSGFHGDGFRYHVYQCRNTHLASMYGWLPEEHGTIFSDSFREAAEGWLDQASVPEQQRPDYDNCEYYYLSHEDNSELLVFFDKAGETLYILESFL